MLPFGQTYPLLGLLSLLLGCGFILSQELCSKIMSGRFDRIKFKSMTWNSTGTLVLFESDFKYIIAKKEMEADPHSLPLPPNQYSWDAAEIGDATQQLAAVSKMRSVYLLRPPKYFTFISAKYDKKLSIVTRKREALWSLKYIRYLTGGAWRPKKIWEDKRIHPDYSVVHDEKEDEGSTGYVIHRDIFDNSSENGDFIVYDLRLDISLLGGDFVFPRQRLDTSPTEKAAARYYLLEKTESPNEITLIHRKNARRRPQEPVPVPAGSPHSRALFSQLPVGYRLNDVLYLFESVRGCVYVLGDFGNLTAAYETISDQYRSRKNIPYERFFKCGGRPYPLAANFAERHPANRCETVYVPLALMPPTPWRIASPEVILVVLLILAIVVALTCILFLFWCKREVKKRTFTKKMGSRTYSSSGTMSSSSTGGTSSSSSFLDPSKGPTQESAKFTVPINTATPPIKEKGTPIKGKKKKKKTKTKSTQTQTVSKQSPKGSSSISTMSNML